MSCKRSRKDAKMQQFVYRDRANVEHAMCDCTGNMWRQRNSNERFKEQFGRHGGETFSIFSTKTAVVGTSHVIRNVLRAETGRLRFGHRHWFSRKSAREKRRVSRDDDEDADNR
jgi:hypothetical protein